MKITKKGQAAPQNHIPFLDLLRKGIQKREEKKVSGKRDQNINVKATLSEQEKLVQVAEAINLSRSATIRMLVETAHRELFPL